jgi:hypothetical protein
METLWLQLLHLWPASLGVIGLLILWRVAPPIICAGLTLILGIFFDDIEVSLKSISVKKRNKK